jgi:hypothetical protein
MRTPAHPLARTFNNVTAEGAAADVPSVVSDAIGWAPRNWRTHVDGAMPIAAVGAALIRDRSAAEDGWRALDAHHNAAAKWWSDWLQER